MAAQGLIYYVEDDQHIRDLAAYALQQAGHTVRTFPDGTGFAALCAAEPPDAVLLDIMLPGDDGLELLRQLRGNPATVALPVMMLTAKGAEYDTVCGLDAGADDYLAKPFGMMEMVSRVKAVLRRSSGNQKEELLQIGDLFLNPKEHTVSAGGERVALTLKEYELLKLLMENQGAVFSREQLMAKIWGDDFVGESRTVDVHIGTLRTKLGDFAGCIETVRGVGYKAGKQK